MKKTVSVKIEGVKPILFHAFKEEVLDKKKTKSGSVGNNPEEWKSTVIMDEQRRLYLPAAYFYAPIKEAGKYTKIGRGNIVKHIAATLEVTPDRIYLDGRIVPEEDKLTRDPTQPVYLDVRSVVNPMTKGRNLRYRIACSDGWQCQFHVSWEDSILSFGQMESILKDAGIMCGTGCGRAIGFGRFKILEFK